MHIVVCAKQVPSPEAPFSMFRIDEAAKRVVPAPGLPMVMSPFDEQAVEAALRIRETHGEAKISIISFGAESARNAIKHGLAMGADAGVLVCDPLLEGGDGYVTAQVLAAAVRKLGDCDLVLAGRQSSDRDAGIVGAGVGELLGWPVLSFAQDVAVQERTLRVERVLEEGSETVEAALPAVVTVSNEIGPARTPNLRETMRAARKPTVQWKAADLGLTAALAPRAVREQLYAPTKDIQCQFLDGPVNEQAARLARHLREASLI